MKSGTRQITGKTTVDALYEQVKEKIISGTYPANQPLRQDALAKEYGISRIPVREALFMLEGDGLVEFRPHKGAVVKPLCRREVEELFHLRALLEGDLLQRSIPKMTDTDLTYAAQALTAYDGVVGSARQSVKWFQLNWDFHAALYTPADQPLALQLIQSLHANTDRYQRIQMSLRGSVPRAHNEHLEILNACRAGQVDEAVRLTRAHILESGRQVQDFLTASEDGV
ncbi:GntR family transcriptional regulator [Paremcibacter congregatus]|uniref:GntR family transcriptional regulator n=1 Tax=Paremcibacter congregatus TaxID=2043170 RepID=UPI0030844718